MNLLKELLKIFFMIGATLVLSATAAYSLQENLNPCDGVDTTQIDGASCLALQDVQAQAVQNYQAVQADTVWDTIKDFFKKIYEVILDAICWTYKNVWPVYYFSAPSFCAAKPIPPGAQEGSGCFSLTSGNIADPERAKDCCDTKNPGKPLLNSLTCPQNYPTRETVSTIQLVAKSSYFAEENIKKAQELINSDTPPIKNNLNGPDEIQAYANAQGAEAKMGSSLLEKESLNASRKGSSKEKNENSEKNGKPTFISNETENTSNLESPTGFSMPLSTLAPALESMIPTERFQESIGIYSSGGGSNSSGHGQSTNNSVQGNLPSEIAFGGEDSTSLEVNPMGSEDPDDYFSRIGRNESLFKRVHDRYQMHALQEMSNGYGRDTKKKLKKK